MLIFLIAILSIFSFQIDIHNEFHTEQLIIVQTKGWNDIQGSMTTYEWKDNRWIPVLKNVPIVTGRSGLAWGKGLHKSELNQGKLKKEGDGNAPAGIYRLTGLFGYQDIEAKMNSLIVDSKTFCVDDLKSIYYNQIVKSDTVKKDWTSAETMRMKTDVYKYGIFVDYNINPTEPGKGSCIFMHVWSGSTAPTAGCTAMTEDNIKRLIGFLDKSKNPLLVQFPQTEYQKMKKLYILP